MKDVPEPAADPTRIADGGEFARELTLARGQAGLTVRQVQEATGIVASTLGGYFAGRHSPPPAGLDAILRACGIDEPGVVRQWHDALGRVRKVPGRRRARSPGTPYRGLESFRPQDAPWFFGRDALVGAVVAALAARAGKGPLVVVGASGAGKSSLLRAGVLPALEARTPVLFTPGERPLDALAAAWPDDPGSLLAVDQFEEVFGPAVDEADRMAFVRALCALDAPVVIALRADFYGRALEYAELARAVQDGQVVVGPMSDDELRAAVVEPARRADVTLEDGLVEVLLADLHRPPAGAAPGLLPLLSHALLATWERGQGVRMTVADYRAVGGIAGGVARSAEEVFTQLPDDRLQLVRRIFLRLVHVAPDVADTRRRVERTELTAGDDGAVAEVLDLFVARRLLTVDEHTVEITHEALLTAWPRLQGWIDADRVGLAAHRRLSDEARTWRDAGHDPDLLLRGGRLAATQETTAQTVAGLNDLERAFLDAAVARDTADRRAERHRTRRLRRLLAVLAVALLVAAGSAGYAVKQRSDIALERDAAVSRQVAGRADVLRVKDPSVAAQLAVAAHRISPTAEARAGLINATGTPTPARLPGPPGTTQAVAGNAGLLVTAAGSGPTAQVWRADSGDWRRLADTPPVADGSVLAVALRPDGRLLATGGTGPGVQLVDLSDPARPVAVGSPLAGAQGAVFAVAFAPDGRTLVAGGADRTVHTWDVTDPARPVAGAVLTGPAAEVQAVAFSPDGRTMAAGGADDAAHLWNLADPARPAGPPLPTGGKVYAVAFSPDGRTLAAGSGDRTVHLWDVSDPAHPPLGEPLTGPTSWVNAVAFSPDGRSLAFGSSDNGLRVVDLPSRRLVALLPHPAPVTSATFLDDHTLASGEADGVARVWRVPGLSGFADSVFALGWSADARELAVGPGSKDGTVSLWRVDGASASPLGPPVADPPGEAKFSGSAALTPDGRTLAVGRQDGSVRLWDVTAPDRPVAVEPPLTGATGQVEQLTTSPDGRTLAVSSDDGTVRLFDITQPRTPRAVATLAGPANYVFAAAFSPDGRLLAAASADRKGYLWDLARPGAPIAVLDGPTSYAYSPAFSPDGRTLAIGSADKAVRLWDVRHPDRPTPLGAPLTGPTNYVYTVTFSPDGRQLAAASTDGTAWLWDVADPAAPKAPLGLVASTDPLFTVAFSPDGRTLAAGGADRSVHLWTVDPQRAADALCARAGAPLTADEWRRHVGDLPYTPPCPDR